MSRYFSLATIVLLASTKVFASAPCDVFYRITPHYDSTPRHIDVELSFDAEGRRESWLRLASWAGINDFGAALVPAPEQAVGVKLLAGDSVNRWKVGHETKGRVSVSYQVRATLDDPDDGREQQQEQLYRTQIGRNWFQFFGYGVLPTVEAWDDTRSGRMCVSVVQPSGEIGPLLGSYMDGKVKLHASMELNGPQSQLRHAFYAGGPGWRVTERQLAGGPVVVASRGPQAVDDTRFADQVAQLLNVHRKFWGDSSSPRQTVVRTPNNNPRNNGGTLVHQTSVLHVSRDFGLSGESFEFLIAHENLHQWFPQRLGGRNMDSPQNYWLSEGFTDYYTHRLLLASGLWTLDRYAEVLTLTLRGYWRSPARNATAESIAPRFFSDRDAGKQMYSRGEMLAMGWDRALRVKDPAGLDGLLRDLLLTSEQAAKAEAPHERVLKALSNSLGNLPRDQVQTHIVQGNSFAMGDGMAGPCFSLGWSEVPRWVLGFDSASFAKRSAIGVAADGPAYKAGLREGMVLRGWSVYGDDTSKEVLLHIKTEGGNKELRYLPVNGSTDRLPTMVVRTGATTDASCQEWIRRE